MYLNICFPCYKFVAVGIVIGIVFQQLLLLLDLTVKCNKEKISVKYELPPNLNAQKPESR